MRADVVSGTLDGDEQVMSTNQYAAYHRINPGDGRQAVLVITFGIDLWGTVSRSV